MSSTSSQSCAASRGANRGKSPVASEPVSASNVALILAALFALNLLLRLFYLRYDFINGDEGVRALTATRWLEGARLYADVVTDKPPGATLFYAGVFAAFGRSMKAVHVAAALWNYATAICIYSIGARFATRRIGLWAAFLFVYFSTNYLTQDTMAANTELLMALPYTAAFGFYVASLRRNPHSVSAVAQLLAAGLATGGAMLFKQVAAFNMLFFTAYEVINIGKSARAAGAPAAKRAALVALFRLSIVTIGFGTVLLGVYAWLEVTGAAHDFWRNAVMLNMFYIESEPSNLWFRFFLRRGTGYVLFNLALFAPAVIAERGRSKQATDNADTSVGWLADPRLKNATVTWSVVTLVSVLFGGRFFGHYCIPALPGLSLLAAIGVQILFARLRDPARVRRNRFALAVLGLLFLFGLVRFHHRTAILAFESLTGTRTKWSQSWGMSKRQEEARVVSRYVSSQVEPGEPLYIWGYAHDVYWQTGCRPASRYLTPYYIDGRFPDAEALSMAPRDEFWNQARANLIADLQRARPRIILNVYGSMLELPYPEIVSFVRRNYREAGKAGPDPSRPFRVLELKETAQEQDR